MNENMQEIRSREEKEERVDDIAALVCAMILFVAVIGFYKYCEGLVCLS